MGQRRAAEANRELKAAVEMVKEKPPKINKIVVDDKGQTFLNEELITVASLKAILQKLKAADPELGVVVKGSDDVDYQHMVNVLDVLQQLEITKVGLATEAGGPLSP